MKVTIIVVILLVIVFGGTQVVAYTNYAYINIYTGSTKWYTKTILGNTLKAWDRKSGFEARLNAIPGIQIQEKWVSYCGTGKTIFGISMSYGHGSPGPILNINEEMMQCWMKGKSDQQIAGAYKILLLDDRKKTEMFTDEVLSEFIK